MANVSVDYQSLQAQATSLTTNKNDIETMLSNLKTQVDNLVAEGFVTDSSSKAFQQSYDEFTTGMNKTIEGLDGMATFLTKAASTFQDVDQQLANALK